MKMGKSTRNAETADTITVEVVKMDCENCPNEGDEEACMYCRMAHCLVEYG